MGRRRAKRNRQLRQQNLQQSTEANRRAQAERQKRQREHLHRQRLVYRRLYPYRPFPPALALGNCIQQDSKKNQDDHQNVTTIDTNQKQIECNCNNCMSCLVCGDPDICVLFLSVCFSILIVMAWMEGASRHLYA